MGLGRRQLVSALFVQLLVVLVSPIVSGYFPASTDTTIRNLAIFNLIHLGLMCCSSCILLWTVRRHQIALTLTGASMTFLIRTYNS